MSFGFLGIQFGFALQNGNTSRILRSFGADVDQLPMFWIVAPLVGMIVQPIIGQYSDRTWNRLGRRKPYFLTGAILSSIALIFLPNSAALSGIVPALWIGAGMVMVMDAVHYHILIFVTAVTNCQQRMGGFTKMRNVFTGEQIALKDFTMKPKESFVFELL